MALIALTDETAPAGGIFKVKLIYTIRPHYTRQVYNTLHNRPVFRKGLRGWNPPPRKICTQISGSTLFAETLSMCSLNVTA